jgi:hypothetical protein
MTRIRFSKSARKHRISRARAAFVVENAYTVLPQMRPGHADVFMHLGDDHTGRALEVGVVVLDDGDVLVIHAMALRPKFREAYEAGRSKIRGTT